MRILVTGVKGQLGYDVMNELAKREHTGIGVDIEEMDITDAAKVEQVIKESEVEAVIHCAAYTAVDAAEDNAELCHKINAEGTENIAKVCKELDLKMIYISTDMSLYFVQLRIAKVNPFPPIDETSTSIDGTDHSISKLMRKGKLVLYPPARGFRSFDRGAGLYQRRQLFVPV